ncbi:MAG: carbohydrate ABC transporter permease [Spirochaetales bacterium]|nr:carbohydrate ABC transporter permease [Spirochaetales bacterium]
MKHFTKQYRMAFYYKLKNTRNLFIYYIILAFFLVIFAYPFFFLLITSTLNTHQIFKTPPPYWFGTNLANNFEELKNHLFFFRSILNSIIIAVSAMMTKIFFCTMIGFTFAKYQFKGKEYFFALVMATLMIPNFLQIIPMYKIMIQFRWINTYLPLVVPTMADSFGIFLMTQFIIILVPDQIIEAARMDGLTGFQILLKIIFPMAMPAVIVLGTISLIFSWNDFMMALIMLPGEEMFTVPIALTILYKYVGIGQINQGTLLLATTLATLPILIFFLFFSKKIMNNFLSGILKG